MTVTISGNNEMMKLNAKYEHIDFDSVQIKEIHRKNGCVKTEIRIKSGKRDVVLSSGVYHSMSIRDEQTGKEIFTYND